MIGLSTVNCLNGGKGRLGPCEPWLQVGKCRTCGLELLADLSIVESQLQIVALDPRIVTVVERVCKFTTTSRRLQQLL